MLLRAIALKPGFIPSNITTQTYLFPDDVLTQIPVLDTSPADGQHGSDIIPAAIGNRRPAEGVDQKALSAGLQSIPAVSLVMDPQNLTGLQANPDERGKDSERPVSFELIFPERAGPGPQVNAGIRPFGEYSELTPKPSFRLFFRGKYGSTKFESPLFPDSRVETFDTLVLQAPGHSPLPGSDSYVRNEWLRSSQLAMSGLGGHGMFVNLYLNGRYAGLYNLIERPDENFMASYLGGEADDWFVANQSDVLNDDPEGDRANELNYLFKALAMAPPGDSNPTPPGYLSETYAAAASYLDPAQLVDYMLLNWYAGSLDWPESSWYAAIRPQDLPGRGKLLIGEAQAASGEHNIHRTFFDTLMQNPDFKIQFADRMYEHLFGDGVLTDANAQARWLELNRTIDQAVSAELARWGRVNRETPQAWDNWRKAQAGVSTQMEGNAARLVARARESGYYPDLDPPVFSRDEGLVEAGFSLTMTLPASKPCPACIIYYTTDGSDPRLAVTGDVIPSATAYSGPLVLTTTTHLKTRTWHNGTWSALHETTFSVVEQDNKLRITEIMYNPVGGDDYEFIELQNLGSGKLDLANISLDEGIRFTFPADARPLAPGQMVVLVSDPVAFANRYPGVKIGGVYEGHLSNKGEKIVLTAAGGQTLLDFAYDDDNGWPLSADGRGDSLTLIDETGTPGNPKNWRAASNLYGSPGAVDRPD